MRAILSARVSSLNYPKPFLRAIGASSAWGCVSGQIIYHNDLKKKQKKIGWEVSEVR